LQVSWSRLDRTACLWTPSVPPPRLNYRQNLRSKRLWILTIESASNSTCSHGLSTIIGKPHQIIKSQTNSRMFTEINTSLTVQPRSTVSGTGQASSMLFHLKRGSDL